MKTKDTKKTKLGDPLERLDSVIDREMFRAPLTKVCQKEDWLFKRRFHQKWHITLKC